MNTHKLCVETNKKDFILLLYIPDCGMQSWLPGAVMPISMILCKQLQQQAITFCN